MTGLAMDRRNVVVEVSIGTRSLDDGNCCNHWPRGGRRRGSSAEAKVLVRLYSVYVDEECSNRATLVRVPPKDDVNVGDRWR